VSIFETDITRKQEASIEIPFSLRKSLMAKPEIFLSFYSTSSMFPLEQTASREGEVLETTPVVAAAFVEEDLYNLTDDVIISFNLHLDGTSLAASL